MRRAIVFAVSLLLFNSESIARTFTPVIQTTKGPVRGEKMLSIWNFPYFSYRGIPYAKPPLGNLRFKESEEVDSWEEVLNATSDASECLQKSGDSVVGSEDCLYMNIFTPELQSKEKMAVMVWIYGGAFSSGSSNSCMYGPDLLMEEGVILATMNYRLGAIGFLSLDHKDALGNAGLKDQLLALKWLKANIEKFGGDPNNITIFGDSAGGASVDFHQLSHRSTGYFQRSISQSASPFCPWAFDKREVAVRRAFRLGEYLGYKTNDKKQLLNFLLNVSGEAIIHATDEFRLFDFAFKPILENPKTAPPDELFISECIINQYTTGDYNLVPHMMGFTEDETISLFNNAQNVLDQLLDYVQDFIDEINNQTMIKPAGWDIITQPIKNITRLEDLPVPIRNWIINFSSDLIFKAEIDFQQRLMVLHMQSIYYYVVKYKTKYSLHRLLFGIDLQGVGHGDDNGYLFEVKSVDVPTDRNDEFNIFRRKMVRLWANFAKFGDPTPLGKKDTLLNTQWPPSGLLGWQMHLDQELKVHPRSIDLRTRLYEIVALTVVRKYTGCMTTLDVIKKVFRFPNLISSLL